LAGHIGHVGGKKNVNSVLVGKTEGKIQLGRFRRRWENNIKMHVREILNLLHCIVYVAYT
jgi:hypothetical protein